MKKFILIACLVALVGCAIPYSHEWKGEQSAYEAQLREETEVAFDLAYENRLIEAAIVCHDVLKREPNYARGYWVLGMVASKGGEFEKASIATRRAISLLESGDALWFENYNEFGMRNWYLKMYKTTDMCYQEGKMSGECQALKELPGPPMPRSPYAQN